MTPIQRAISIIGGPSKTARELGVTPQAVCFWRDGKRIIPSDQCPSIERATAGAVICEDLRPDIAWVRIPDKDWPHPQGRPLIDHAAKNQEKKAP